MISQCAVSRCFIIPVRSQITPRKFHEKCFHVMGFDNNKSDVIHTKRGLAGTRKIILGSFSFACFGGGEVTVRFEDVLYAKGEKNCVVSLYDEEKQNSLYSFYLCYVFVQVLKK